VGKFLTATLKIIAVFGLDGVLNGTGDRVIDTQDGALNQLDLASSIAAQGTTTVSTSRRLALAPGLGG